MGFNDTQVQVWAGEYLQHTPQMYYLEQVKGQAEQGRKQVADKVRELQGQGVSLLMPYKFSFDRGCNNRINHTGRAIVLPYASMDGQFTQVQLSAYKKYKPFKVHTYLWQVEACPALLYGTIGISNRVGRINEIGDLILILDKGNRLQVWVFKGFANPLNNGLPTGLPRAVAYLKGRGLLSVNK